MQFVQSKMRNGAAEKHKVEDIIAKYKEANSPLSSNAQTLKCCQLQGASTP